MLIELENLNFKYKIGTNHEKHALKDINLTLKQGEFVGLIGHSGSGKSTLIGNLNGLHKPCSGKVYIDGKDIYSKKYPIKNLRRKIGIVFQQAEHQLFEESVIKDVCYGPLKMGMSVENALNVAEEALNAVNIPTEYYDRSPFTLSGGQKRRVAIAGVLAMKPDILILDEPTAGLDPTGRKRILDKVYELNKNNKLSIILVSHSMDDIAKYVERVVVMDKGSIRYDDTPKNVFSHYKELEEIGLMVPQVTCIMKRLKEKGFLVNDSIVTLDEAKNEILNILQQNYVGSR